jgi:hypothetical protein
MVYGDFYLLGAPRDLTAAWSSRYRYERKKPILVLMLKFRQEKRSTFFGRFSLKFIESGTS